MNTNYNTNLNDFISFNQFPEKSLYQNMKALRDLKIKLYKAMVKSKLKKISCKIIFIDIFKKKEVIKFMSNDRSILITYY